MADNNGTFVNGSLGQSENLNVQPTTESDTIKSIDNTLKDLLKVARESDRQNSLPAVRQTQQENKWTPKRRPIVQSTRNAEEEFVKGVQTQLMEGLFQSDFSDKIQDSLEDFADALGVPIKDIPNELGKSLGKTITDAVRQSRPGRVISQYIENVQNTAADALNSMLSTAATNVRNARGQSSNATQSASTNSAASSTPSVANSAATSTPVNTVNDVASQTWISVAELWTTTAESWDAVANRVIEAFNQDNRVDQLTDVDQSLDTNNSISDFIDNTQQAGDIVSQAASNVFEGGEEVEVLTGDILPTVAQQGTEVAAAAGQAGAAAAGAAGGTLALGEMFSGLMASLGPLIASLGPVAVALVALEVASEALGPAIEGVSQFLEALKVVGNREEESRKKNLKAAEARIKAVNEAITVEPFKILQEAAEKVEAAWDDALQTITATQGYTKADVQDLMASYAQRLRTEGLSSVISGADLTSNLSKVLSSGLSGQVAEEFAYIATKLNAAIPTEDFFSYGQTYASLAANAIKDGASQSEAIAYANSQLEQFASNLLYASRQISGGFSTGLTGASQLLEDAVKIANASRQGDASQISGVLTSVSALVGAIAPDLGQSLVQTVVDAAIGGNANTSLVALRSLANVNASNTEFLKTLASNPKAIFSELFNNLAELQNMSSDNYMEVAEGLSNVFGVSMDAFTRVDFAYLAKAISAMDENNTSLNDNMKLLVSGQTTSTAEQLRMQQINQYMIEEGLAYVLDNQVARSIQEQMWREQQTREITETEYAVNLQGSALSLLSGIKKTVQNILNFLNPAYYLKKIGSIFTTSKEATGLQADVTSILELGKVGTGRYQDLQNLIHTNANLQLTPTLVELMGGVSQYKSVGTIGYGFGRSSYGGTGSSRGLNRMEAFTNGLGEFVDSASGITDSIQSSIDSFNSISNSVYSWGMVSKSYAKTMSNLTSSVSLGESSARLTSTSETLASQAQSRLQSMLDSMESAVKENKTFEEWKSTANKFGIADLGEALQSLGVTESDLEGQFQSQEMKAASEYKHKREVQEDLFWQEGIDFWATEHPEYRAMIYEKWDTQHKWDETLDTDLNMFNESQMLWNAALDKRMEANHKDWMAWIKDVFNVKLVSFDSHLANIENIVQTYLNRWVDYYVNHTAYSKETLNAYDVAGVRNAERSESGDAVLALAQALTRNTVDLKDPAVQTNTLLAKILIVLEAIMQQNNKTGAGALATSLAALGLGMDQES